jgi:hypothetical protein
VLDGIQPVLRILLRTPVIVIAKFDCCIHQAVQRYSEDVEQSGQRLVQNSPANVKDQAKPLIKTAVEADSQIVLRYGAQPICQFNISLIPKSVRSFL